MWHFPNCFIPCHISCWRPINVRTEKMTNWLFKGRKEAWWLSLKLPVCTVFYRVTRNLSSSIVLTRSTFYRAPALKNTVICLWSVKPPTRSTWISLKSNGPTNNPRKITLPVVPFKEPLGNILIRPLGKDILTIKKKLLSQWACIQRRKNMFYFYPSYHHRI